MEQRQNCHREDSDCERDGGRPYNRSREKIDQVVAECFAAFSIQSLGLEPNEGESSCAECQYG